MKKFLPFLLMLALCFSLTSCGEVTTESILNDARDFVSDVDSVNCATMTGMEIKQGEESFTTFFNMDADLDFENRCHYMILASESNEEQMVLDIYIDSRDEVNYYIGANDKWVKMENIDETILKNANFSMDLSRDFEVYFTELLENKYTEMTVEELEGEEYYKFYAPVSIDSLEKAKLFGIDSFITGFLGDDASSSVINAAIDALGEVDVTVYISTDDCAPYGFVMDLKPALDTLYKNIGITDIEVGEAYSSSVYTDYDDSEVEIPEKVLSAPDASSIIAQNNAQ